MFLSTKIEKRKKKLNVHVLSFLLCFDWGVFSHRYCFVVFLLLLTSLSLSLLALHVLADRVELFMNSARTAAAAAVKIRRRRHDVDRADLGPFERRHRVLAEHLEQNVPDDDGKAGDKDPHERVLIELDDDPGAGTGDAHQRHDDDRLGPVLDREALLPVEAIAPLNLVRRLAHLALEHRIGGGTTFHEPPPQTLVVYGAYVTGTFAWLDERFGLFAVVTDPAVLLRQEGLTLLGGRSGRFRFLGRPSGTATGDGVYLAC